jgi:hypothetical protein
LYIGDECSNSIHRTWTDQIFQPFGRFRLSLLEYWIQKLTIYSTVIYVFLVVITR